VAYVSDWSIKRGTQLSEARSVLADDGQIVRSHTVAG
jgi:hypothetical protein